MRRNLVISDKSSDQSDIMKSGSPQIEKSDQNSNTCLTGNSISLIGDGISEQKLGGFCQTSHPSTWLPNYSDNALLNDGLSKQNDSKDCTTACESQTPNLKITPTARVNKQYHFSKILKSLIDLAD